MNICSPPADASEGIDSSGKRVLYILGTSIGFSNYNEGRTTGTAALALRTRYTKQLAVSIVGPDNFSRVATTVRRKLFLCARAAGKTSASL